VALLVLYSIWILVVSVSFWVVRVDNLSFFFSSLFDVGRWPISVFRGTVFHVIFTFFFPVALMTTYPAEALLGRLAPARRGRLGRRNRLRGSGARHVETRARDVHVGEQLSYGRGSYRRWQPTGEYPCGLEPAGDAGRVSPISPR